MTPRFWDKISYTLINGELVKIMQPVYIQDANIQNS